MHRQCRVGASSKGSGGGVAAAEDGFGSAKGADCRGPIDVAVGSCICTETEGIGAGARYIDGRSNVFRGCPDDRVVVEEIEILDYQSHDFIVFFW